MLDLTILRKFALEDDAIHLCAMAEAQASILASLMLLGAPLFLFFAAMVFLQAHASSCLMLGMMGLLTGGGLFIGQSWLKRRTDLSLATLEKIACVAVAAVYINVVTYLLLDFGSSKIFYFILMPIIFSVASVTFRLAIASVAISMATLAGLTFYTSLLAPDERTKLFVATATIVVAIFLLFRRVVVRQVRARVAARDYAAEMERQACLDPLTGLSNRRIVFKRLDELVDAGNPMWLGLLDLNGLKAINERHGQKTGDNVLSGIAARLSSTQIPGLSIGRLGGDEFALIFEGQRDGEDVKRLCMALIAAVEQPGDGLTIETQMSGSIGLVSFPDTAVDVPELCEKAGFSLCKAKALGRGAVVAFDAREAAEFRGITELEKQLAEADLDNELFLAFQPQVDPSTNKATGFEALVRWNSPALGLVSPDRFIRCAERIGLIKSITRVVLDKGLTVLAVWPQTISMSFNISAQNVADAAFLAELLDIIEKAGIEPSRVEFEITETAILSDPDAARKALSTLAEAGCSIALDDFGVGYSSLQHLRKLPLNKIKIDRSFVRDASASRQSLEIIAALTGLCRQLGLACVLEGVETEEELALLAPFRPDRIQGYLFGRPMSPEAAFGFLSASDVATIAAQ